MHLIHAAQTFGGLIPALPVYTDDIPCLNAYVAPHMLLCIHGFNTQNGTALRVDVPLRPLGCFSLHRLCLRGGSLKGGNEQFEVKGKVEPLWGEGTNA